jgi:2,5-diketo-D-gluconate reductase A
VTPLVPTLPLNNGARIPQLGLGVMGIPSADLPAVLADAAALGYRHIDTATHDGNEAGVGEGIARLEMPRDDLFVVTKLPNAAHGYDEGLRAFDRSERAIGQWQRAPRG